MDTSDWLDPEDGQHHVAFDILVTSLCNGDEEAIDHIKRVVARKRVNPEDSYTLSSRRTSPRIRFTQAVRCSGGGWRCREGGTEPAGLSEDGRRGQALFSDYGRPIYADSRPDRNLHDVEDGAAAALSADGLARCAA
jgi:hypothetical protein